MSETINAVGSVSTEELIRIALAEVNEELSITPNREGSICRTKLEEALFWYQRQQRDWQ